MADSQAACVAQARPPDGPGVRPAWDWNRVLTPRLVVRMLPVIALLVWAYGYPLLRWEAIWRHDSAWNHGYLIPVLAVLLASYRLKEQNPARLDPSLWGVPLVLAGCVLRVWGQTLMYGYPSEVTFLLVSAGVLLLLLGPEAFRALWVPVAYLALMIPMDVKYYESIALPLQTLGAAVGERLLRLVGMVVERQGNVLYLQSGPIEVAKACSGLHLLFAFVALGVLMAYMYRQPLWERLVIMISSVPIAVFCNIIRVSLMALASDTIFFEQQAVAGGAPTWSARVPEFVWAWFEGGDLAARLGDLRTTVLDPASALHQSFGFAMLALAFLLMEAELRIINLFFVEDTSPEEASPEAGGAAGG